MYICIYAVLEIKSRAFHMSLPLGYAPNESSYIGFTLGNLNHWAGNSLQLLSATGVFGSGKLFYSEHLITLADTGTETSETRTRSYSERVIGQEEKLGVSSIRGTVSRLRISSAISGLLGTPAVYLVSKVNFWKVLGSTQLHSFCVCSQIPQDLCPSLNSLVVIKHFDQKELKGRKDLFGYSFRSAYGSGKSGQKFNQQHKAATAEERSFWLPSCLILTLLTFLSSPDPLPGIDAIHSGLGSSCIN
jgi:hypothetical protein